MLTKHPQKVVLAAIMCVATVEIVATARQPGEALTPAHWKQAEERLRPDTPLVIGTSWLAPEARMRIAIAGAVETSGRPDLRGLQTFDVLRHETDRTSSPERWGDLLGSRSSATLHAVTHAGALVIEHWNIERPEQLVDRLTHPTQLTVQKNDDRVHSCVGDPTSGYRCSMNRGAKPTIVTQFAEIDYQPRRCLSMPLPYAGALTFRRENFERGDRIIGHLGFEDFNARLRNDGPVTVTIDIDGEEAGRSTFTNGDGWAGFELATAAGRGPLTITVESGASGQWKSPPERYAPRAPRRICLELRSLQGAAAP